MTDIALVVAVGEPRCDLPQVASSDRFTAPRTKGSRPGCPAIHQDELHVPLPNEKQNTGSRELIADPPCLKIQIPSNSHVGAREPIERTPASPGR
jgi:hypothetical protein